jgi:AraC family carnitine catabolism transcriptional activator
MQDNVKYPLDIEMDADRCGISERELQYLFRQHLSTSPKKIYIAFRLQHAKELFL